MMTMTHFTIKLHFLRWKFQMTINMRNVNFLLFFNIRLNYNHDFCIIRRIRITELFPCISHVNRWDRMLSLFIALPLKWKELKVFDILKMVKFVWLFSIVRGIFTNSSDYFVIRYSVRFRWRFRCRCLVIVTFNFCVWFSIPAAKWRKNKVQLIILYVE